MKPTFALCLSLLLAASSARAENSVVVESKTVLARAQDVHVGVFVSNDVYVTGIGLPLEFRSITPGSYVAGTFVPEFVAAGRAYPILCDTAGWINGPVCLPWRMPVLDTSSCSGPTSHTYRTVSTQIDFISPDAVAFFAVSTGDPGAGSVRDISIPPGADPLVSDLACIRLRFGVTSTPGLFEIDTCCVRPANHIVFIDTLTEPVVPAFTKGVITIIPCSCPCSADPVCDGLSNALDVSTLIDVAFRGTPDISDSTCNVSRTDVNADGRTDVVDVVRMIFVVFLGQPPEKYFVNPCP